MNKSPQVYNITHTARSRPELVMPKCVYLLCSSPPLLCLYYAPIVQHVLEDHNILFMNALLEYSDCYINNKIIVLLCRI